MCTCFIHILLDLMLIYTRGFSFMYDFPQSYKWSSFTPPPPPPVDVHPTPFLKMAHLAGQSRAAPMTNTHSLIPGLKQFYRGLFKGPILEWEIASRLALGGLRDFHGEVNMCAAQECAVTNNSAISLQMAVPSDNPLPFLTRLLLFGLFVFTLGP